MMLDAIDLRIISPRCPHPEAFADILSRAMTTAGIKSVTHAAGFLAQLCHESNEFRASVEDSDGTYLEGRSDLGNTEKGDGPRFRGRGWSQLTGRSNYRDAGAAIGLDLTAHPEAAEDPEVSGAIAAWFWRSKACAAESDKGIEYLRRRWNNGLNGIDEVKRYYFRALEVLGRRATL